MSAIFTAKPVGAASILVVAKDVTGNWLVQEALGRLIQHFASFEAALDFACHAPSPFADAAVAISCASRMGNENGRGYNA